MTQKTLILSLQKEARTLYQKEVAPLTESTVDIPVWIDEIIVSAVTKTASAVMEECLPTIKPETRGTYGDHDKLHIQSNIGWNEALDATLDNYKRFSEE